MISVKLISKITNRVIERTYTARQILSFFDEEDLASHASKCDCQPVGETNLVECNCDAEWEDYTLLIGEELGKRDNFWNDMQEKAQKQENVCDSWKMVKLDVISPMYAGEAHYVLQNVVSSQRIEGVLEQWNS